MQPVLFTAVRATAAVGVALFGLTASSAIADDLADIKKSSGHCQDKLLAIGLRLEACDLTVQLMQLRGSLTPHNQAIVFINRGIAYDDNKQYDRAIQDYDQAIKLDPSYALAFYNRGSAYFGKKQYDQAIRDYDQTIKLDPSYTSAFYNRGLAYSIKKQYDRAIQDYDQAIKLRPSHAGTFHNRGNAFLNTKQYDRAIQDYDQAIRLNPNDVLAFNNRGVTYSIKKQYDRAIQDYDQAIRLDPANSDSFFRLANIQFAQGDFLRSAANKAKAYELGDPDIYKALFLYAARSRAGQDGKTELAKHATKLDLAKWPGAAVKLFLGQAQASSLATARGTSDLTNSEWECEMNFFLGLHALLAGDKKSAEAYFRKSVATGETDFIEHQYAEAELKRLGAK